MTIAALPSQFFSLQLQLFLPARQPATLALQRQSREVLGMGMGKEMARAQGIAVKVLCMGMGKEMARAQGMAVKHRC